MLEIVKQSLYLFVGNPNNVDLGQCTKMEVLGLSNHFYLHDFLSKGQQLVRHLVVTAFRGPCTSPITVQREQKRSKSSACGLPNM